MDISAALPTISTPNAIRWDPTETKMRALHAAAAAAHQGSPLLGQSRSFGWAPLLCKTHGFTLPSPLRKSSSGERGLGQKNRGSPGFEGESSAAAFAVRASKSGNAGVPDGRGGDQVSGSVPDDPKALRAALLAAELEHMKQKKQDGILLQPYQLQKLRPRSMRQLWHKLQRKLSLGWKLPRISLRPNFKKC